MKKSLILSLAMAVLLVIGTGPAMAQGCCGVETDADTYAVGGVWSAPFTAYSHNPNGEDLASTQGYIGFDLGAKAEGTESAFATVEYTGDGWDGRRVGAFQTDIGGGELSGAGGISVTNSAASGHAKGVDSGECNNGADYANVDLEVTAKAYQHNQAFSDDLDSFIGGSNYSYTKSWAESDKTDYGTNDYISRSFGQTWYDLPAGAVHYATGWFTGLEYYYVDTLILDLDAEVFDQVSATAIAAGGTLVYAKQTDNSALVAGITGSASLACDRFSEHDYQYAEGAGRIGGVAVLPSTGFAGFNAGYEYAGGSGMGYGVAGGISKVKMTQSPGTMNITVKSTAFSKASVGGSDNVPASINTY